MEGGRKEEGREGGREEGREGDTEGGEEGRGREETERFTSTNIRRCFVQYSMSFFYRD